MKPDYPLVSDTSMFLVGQADCVYGYARRNKDNHYLNGFSQNYSVQESISDLSMQIITKIAVKTLAYHHGAIDTALTALKYDPILANRLECIEEVEACYKASLSAISKLTKELQKE